MANDIYNYGQGYPLGPINNQFTGENEWFNNVTEPPMGRGITNTGVGNQFAKARRRMTDIPNYLNEPLNTLDPNFQNILRQQNRSRWDQANVPDERGFLGKTRDVIGNQISRFTTPVMSALKGIKNQFEYRPATEEAWDPNTGQFVSAEEQDKMNALGGYYSDAARNQRRQRARVINMIKRRDAKQAYSKKNLARLQDLGYGPKETITTTAGGPEGYQDYGQGAASQEIQRSYEGPGGGYTGAGEAADWGGGEAYGGLTKTHSRGRYNKGGRVGILSIF